MAQAFGLIYLGITSSTRLQDWRIHLGQAYCGSFGDIGTCPESAGLFRKGEAMETDFKGEQSSGKWWHLPARFMRVDYAPDFSQVKYMDLGALAKSRVEDWGINCEWVVGTPGFGDAGHLVTFKAEGYETYPGFEDFDYLRTYTPIAHKHGLRVISYLNAHFYSKQFAQDHPGWEQITCRGEAYGDESPLYGHGTTLCVNSPWREWAFGLIREAMKTGIDGVFLDGPVIFPDCCYCSHCERKFRDRYGADIPQEDWTNSIWRQFVSFREDSMAEFLQGAQQAVHDVHPDGVIHLNAGSWQPGGWRGAREILRVQPYQEINGAESFFYYGLKPSLYETLMTGKYLRAGKNPSMVFTHYMNGLWHYLLLPPHELEMALVQTAASGANPWIAFFNCGLDARPNGHEPAKKVFSFMARNEEYYKDTESIADVGILFSAKTARFYLSRHEEFSTGGAATKEENLVLERDNKTAADLNAGKRNCEEFLSQSRVGFFEALTRAHVPFDIILDSDLTQHRLSKYRALVLPDAVCLTEEEVQAIRSFVRDGGCLLSTFEGGLYREDGEPSDLLFDVLGIDRVDGMFPVVNGENYLIANENHLGFRQRDLIERSPYALKIRTTASTRTLEQLLNPVDGCYLPLEGVSQYPGLITHSFGKGRVAYFAEALGVVCEAGLPAAEDRLCGVLRKLVGGFLVEVDAPRTVSVECRHQRLQRRVILHIVNNTVDGRPVRQFLPVNNVQLKLCSPDAPQSVVALSEGGSVESSYSQGVLCMTIPVLDVYEVLVIQY